MLIGITDSMSSEDKFSCYIQWLEKSGVLFEWIKLSYKFDNLADIDRCNGLLLTGGNDVDPMLYNGPKNHPKIIDVDKRRDDFERKLLDKVFRNKIPTLAICRGMQLVNIHFGGTLIPDIEEAGYNSHRSMKNGENRHKVIIKQKSGIHELTCVNSGSVNSSHHQAVDKPGNGFNAVAHADDGIIEGMEFDKDRDNHFFLLVQWHPERMADSDNPLSTEISKKYLTKISNQSKT
jgi:putative glutamine amidotransferase